MLDAIFQPPVLANSSSQVVGLRLPLSFAEEAHQHCLSPIPRTSGERIVAKTSGASRKRTLQVAAER